MRWSGISDRLRTIGSRWRCPDEARLAGFVDRGLGEKGETSIMQHLVRCTACRSQVALLTRMQRPDAESYVPAAWLIRAEAITDHQAEVSAIRNWAVIVAVAVCAVATTAILLRPHSPALTHPMQATTPNALPQIVASAAAPPQLSSGGKQRNREVVRKIDRAAALQITSPAEGARIIAGSRIRWHSVENSTHYEVRLLSADGEVLWNAKMEATQAVLPDDVPATSQRKCFLLIRAYLPDGKTVESGVIGVILQPRS